MNETTGAGRLHRAGDTQQLLKAGDSARPVAAYSQQSHHRALASCQIWRPATADGQPALDGVLSVSQWQSARATLDLATMNYRSAR